MLPGVYSGWPVCRTAFPHSSPGKLLLSLQAPAQIALPLGSPTWSLSGSDIFLGSHISLAVMPAPARTEKALKKALDAHITISIDECFVE